MQISTVIQHKDLSYVGWVEYSFCWTCPVAMLYPAPLPYGPVSDSAGLGWADTGLSAGAGSSHLVP